MPTESRSAMSTGTSCIVEQFGLAMMPSCQSRSSGFTWLTTSGTFGSIRHADELSITVAPRATACGASSFEMSAPALNRAMSTPSNASATASPISIVRPWTSTVRPAERPDASNRRSPTGKSRSPSTLTMVRPTTPVAPTMATVRGLCWLIRRRLRAWLRRDQDQAGTVRSISEAESRDPGEAGVSILCETLKQSRSALADGDRLLGEVALHGRLAREVDPALAIDLDHHDHHLVAHGHDVLDGRDVVVRELADADEALLARQ